MMLLRRLRRSHAGIFLLGLVMFTAGITFVLPTSFAVVYERSSETVREEIQKETAAPSLPKATHVATPEAVKGIYMSQCVAATPSFRDSLTTFVKDTDLNTLVIDIKDFTGYISFPTDNPVLASSVSKECLTLDMAEYIRELHADGIYVIGRITVFQDPRYTKLHPEHSVQSVSRPGEPWKDRKGLSFISPLAKPYWEYVRELSRVAYEDLGFDEINYDYIRWPSDGDIEDVMYPIDQDRAEAVEHFWHDLKEHTPDGAVISADLFGYTAIRIDDLGIGQQLERALPYFDYIMPMVYPSHYGKGFMGLANASDDPHLVVLHSMREAVWRAQAATTTVPGLTHTPIMKSVLIPASAGVATTTESRFSGVYEKASYSPRIMRPWLQDFNYPVPYTPDMIAAQIRATEDSGLNSWIFWDAGNKYTSLRKVLAVPTTPSR